LRSFRRIGLESQRDIHPIQRVQVIEVNDVILHHLRAGDQVANQARVFRNFDLERVFDGADTGQSMHHGAHSANPLRPNPGFARIALLQNYFDTAKHRACAPGVRYLSTVQLSFNA